MKNVLLLLAIILNLSFTGLPERLIPHIVPVNELKLPPSKTHTKGNEVTKENYLKVTSVLHKLYAPMIKKKSGLEFIMNADWEDATVNAYATREVESWSVHIPGGIARAEGMTKDSLALIVCHEIGHHLGGAPRTFLYEGWPSAEGQADYWAASKCLKRYYQEYIREEVKIDQTIPEKIISDCTKVYKLFNDQKICIRTMIANMHFAEFLNSLPRSKKGVNILTPDERVVKGTNTNDYPRPQCRVDTIYQGALCSVDSLSPNSDTDPLVGNCIDQVVGSRPKCWFKQ